VCREMTSFSAGNQPKRPTGSKRPIERGRGRARVVGLKGKSMLSVPSACCPFRKNIPSGGCDFRSTGRKVVHVDAFATAEHHVLLVIPRAGEGSAGLVARRAFTARVNDVDTRSTDSAIVTVQMSSSRCLSLSVACGAYPVAAKHIFHKAQPSTTITSIGGAITTAIRTSELGGWRGRRIVKLRFTAMRAHSRAPRNVASTGYAGYEHSLTPLMPCCDVSANVPPETYNHANCETRFFFFCSRVLLGKDGIHTLGKRNGVSVQ
jgi:hypothetical protein